jgi:hypothetical protein
MLIQWLSAATHAVSEVLLLLLLLPAAGLAAGFDKDAEAIKGLMGLGLGFMEVGEHSSLGWQWRF